MSSENETKGYRLEEGVKELLDRLQGAVMSYNAEKAKILVQEIIDKNIDPLVVMNHVIAHSARVLGEKFETGEIFLPHLVLGGDIMSKISGRLQSTLTPEQAKKLAGKVVIIGTVEGDVHSIGKSIVAMLLQTNGFKVHDLGVNVKSDVFIERAKASNADIIALSSLLTTTMPYQREVIEDLKDLNLRSKFKVMIGGGPTNQGWADEIGADGYGKDAVEAVKVAQHLTGTS